jgi:uncharacterized protein with PIN domain
MGLILDSSVVIAAERRGDTVEQLIEEIVKATGDQEAALSAIGLTELIHGLYRAQTPEIRQRRESFLNELLTDPTVYPYMVGQVAIHAVENLHGGFAVDGAHIGAGLGRPDDGDPFRRWRFGHLPRKHTRRSSRWCCQRNFPRN